MVYIGFLVIFVKNIGNFLVFWCGFYIAPVDDEIVVICVIGYNDEF